jgi:hypothetical protein
MHNICQSDSSTGRVWNSNSRLSGTRFDDWLNANKEAKASLPSSVKFSAGATKLRSSNRQLLRFQFLEQQRAGIQHS